MGCQSYLTLFHISKNTFNFYWFIRRSLCKCWKWGWIPATKQQLLTSSHLGHFSTQKSGYIYTLQESSHFQGSRSVSLCEGGSLGNPNSVARVLWLSPLNRFGHRRSAGESKGSQASLRYGHLVLLKTSTPTEIKLGLLRYKKQTSTRMTAHFRLHLPIESDRLQMRERCWVAHFLNIKFIFALFLQYRALDYMANSM